MNNDTNEMIVVGNTVPSGHTAGRIFDIEGISPTVMYRHSKVVQILENKLKNEGVNNMKEFINNLTQYNFKMDTIKLFDSFAGIGSLHQSLTELGVPIEIVGMSEIEVDAIISYAGIHIDNFKDLEFEYPSEDDMRELLMSRNIGWDFIKQKSSIPRLKKDKLYKVYKATALLNNLGDISQLDYNNMIDFDLFNFSFPCFVAGTLVLTDKGYKKIEEIKEGDNVLTHTNTYQRVVKPMINKADNIYRLKTMCSEDLLVTEEHPFYVRKRVKINTRVHGEPYRERKFNEPEWVKVKDLSKDYYVGVAINQKSELPKWNGFEVNNTYATRGNKKLLNNLSKYFNNEDFWWFVGRYLGDGWVGNRTDNKGTDIYNLYICCAKDELNEITEVLDKLNLIDNEFKYKYYDNKAVWDIRIANVEFAKFLQQFGKGAKNKCLNESILDLPINLLKGFLTGYMSADGCFTQGLNKASSISKELIYGIGQCVAKVYNKPFSIYINHRKPTCVIEGRIVNQQDGYQITWKNEKKIQDQAFYEDGYIWCPINGIEKEEYNGLVYNMEVENDNSYTVNNIIVHNCTDISGAGQQKGLTNEDGTPTRSGLVKYGIEVIKSKKPKYIMIENVKALIQKKFIDDFNDIVNEIESYGYKCYYPKKENGQPTCLNAKNYGIAQNRERIFVICVRTDVDDGLFNFPEGFDNGLRLKDFLEDEVDEKYYLSQEIQDRFKLNGKEDIEHNELNVIGTSAPECRTIGQRDITYGVNGIMSTLTATDYKQPKQILDTNDIKKSYLSNAIEKTIIKNNGVIPEAYDLYNKNPINNGIAKTLSCDCGHMGTAGCTAITDNFRIRKLTPKECFRLMGFRDECFDRAKELGTSDSALYKEAGNSIVVNCLYYIFKELFKKYIVE